MFLLPFIVALSVDLHILVDGLNHVMMQPGSWFPYFLSWRSAWLLVAVLSGMYHCLIHIRANMDCSNNDAM